MDDFPWAARPARSPVPAVERDEPTVCPIVAADVAESSDAMTSEPHAAARTYYDARKPRRAPSIVLAVLLVGVAGAVYWSSLSRVQSTEPGTVTVEAREHGAAAPGSPVPRAEPKSEASASTPEPVPTTAARQTQEPASAQPVSPPVDAAANSAPAQPVGDAPSQTAERSKTADTLPAVGAPPGSGDAPAATARPRKTADAPPAIESDAVDSTEARAAAKSAARRGDDARRRTPPYMRTREQAERDALATQRLIARDLGNAPPPKAAPGTGLPP